MASLEFVDSHTEGEPTRVIFETDLPLIGSTAMEKRAYFNERHDRIRELVVTEPRASEIIVGAWVGRSENPDCVASVIFFNNAGFLGMCGHGTIGVAKTVWDRDPALPNLLSFETPVGRVTIERCEPGEIKIENVASYRHLKDIQVQVDAKVVRGDVAYGGNWFFLTDDSPVSVNENNLPELSLFTISLKRELGRQGITGADGAEIDHIEIFGPPSVPGAHSKNFVLCPGNQYDRSPCGTGTSAKLASLYEDNKLNEGEEYVQESILGTRFVGSVAIRDGAIVPSIKGRAWITGRGVLEFDPADPIFGLPGAQ